MKKPALFVASLTLLLTMLLMPAHASISISGTINGNIYVVYNLENLNATIYNEVKTNQQFNISTIPTTIVKNLENQGRKQVLWAYGPQTDIFDDANNAIHVSFYLGGPDIIGFTANRTTMQRTYYVKTEWRRFQLNLTSGFSINFTQYFNTPVAEWQKTDYNDTQGNKHPAYYYKATDTGFFNMTSFQFILPATATNIQRAGDTIAFEVPPYPEDIFLNSPFLILAAIIIIIIIALLYRRLR